jgi:hypothetical protein
VKLRDENLNLRIAETRVAQPAAPKAHDDAPRQSPPWSLSMRLRQARLAPEELIDLL